MSNNFSRLDGTAGQSSIHNAEVMAFQRHPIQNQRIMFITTNTKDRIPVFRDPTYANEVLLAIYRTQQIHPYFLYGFVVMPDHCHLLLSAPEYGSVSRIMHTFKRGVSFALELGSLWQSRFFIVYPKSPGKVLEYIHANPVRAGLCSRVDEYPWSSGSGRHDVSPLPDSW